jgi:uncharacterized membrane protein YfcA
LTLPTNPIDYRLSMAGPDLLIWKEGSVFELAVGAGIAVILVAFAAEYVDSTLGMGYGTALTPLLLLFGFEPLQIVPAVLLSELITGLLAAAMHHSVGNVDLKPKSTSPGHILSRVRELGVAESFRRGIPLHLKVALLLAVLSIVGTVAAVFLAINLPKFYIKLYIGLLVLDMGVVILATMNRHYGFSWLKIAFLGLVASFNKGMSGGGYGPVVTGGQLLAGVEGKNAIGITSLAEGLTCAVGLAAYILTGRVADWILAPYLVIGAVLSVPLSAYTVKRIRARGLRAVIGIVSLLLGAITLIKLVL